MIILLILMSVTTHAAVPQKLVTVVVRKAEKVTIAQPLSYPAQVQTRVNGTVLAEADGVIRKIHFGLGQSVRRGQALLTVQQTDPIFKFAPTQSKSPVRGVVNELFVTEGALVTKGQKLASVTDTTNLRVVIEVPARDLSLVPLGLVGRLELASVVDPIEVKLSGVSPSVDPATGTATAELLPNPKDIHRLRPGIVGKTTFQANPHTGFLVPEDAIVQVGDKALLRVVKEGKVFKTPVSLGARTRGFVEVKNGLVEGALIVERTSGFVGDGESVHVEEARRKEAAF